MLRIIKYYDICFYVLNVNLIQTLNDNTKRNDIEKWKFTYYYINEKYIKVIILIHYRNFLKISLW